MAINRILVVDEESNIKRVLAAEGSTPLQIIPSAELLSNGSLALIVMSTQPAVKTISLL